MKDILNYYTSQSSLTDPGKYVTFYHDLPDDPAELIRVINNVLIHYRAARDLKIQLTRTQRKEQRLRTMKQRLASFTKYGLATLAVPLEDKEKQIGWCREFAVFFVSILRQKGIPARMRVGFESYFIDSPFYGDHWIAEFWDTSRCRWRLADPDIGGSDPALLESRTRLKLKSNLDFTDIRHNEQFLPAAHAWKSARMGDVKPERYRANRRWKGWPCLRGNLLHDFQALNKTELMIWDYWDDLISKPENEVNAADREKLDRIADLLLSPDEVFEEMQALYEELPRTRVIRSRLRLMGILGETHMKTATGVTVSDFDRLNERVRTPDGEDDQSFTGFEGTPVVLEDRSPRPVTHDPDHITVKGARQNNLKNIDVAIPRNKLVVITGVSGSGKSSLAFDTIYAEGQRRYVESLSTYARQFMRQMEKPAVDQVIGLNPAVAIEQRTVAQNSRSTVGSMTEVIDYLRILFSRLGQMHCPQCGRGISPQSAQQITKRLVQLPARTQFQLGTNSYSVSDDQHFRIQVLQDVEQGLARGNGILELRIGEDSYLLSDQRLCPSCGIRLPRLEPQLLNYNTVYGMCPECDGVGLMLQVDPELVISKPHKSLMDDASTFYAISNLRKSSSDMHVNYYKALAAYYGADLELPWNELPEAFRKVVLFGTGGEKIKFQYAWDDGSVNVERDREVIGVIAHINRLFRQTKSEAQRRHYLRFMSQQPCPVCEGERLGKEARYVTLDEVRFPEAINKNIGSLLVWVQELKTRLTDEQQQIGGELLKELEQRLQFICDVGLHYLSLNRPAPTLSGGEAQRIRLASQIGSELVGVLYVLDEPSIGLHSRDQEALLSLLARLRDFGNTVLVVEHDLEAMRAADWLIDIGPGAGLSGGEVIAAGTPEDVMGIHNSLTGRYLSGKLSIETPNLNRRRSAQGWLTLRGGRLHNLKNVDVQFPLRTFICVTGVSGAGKSSLITKTLSPALRGILQNARDIPGEHDELLGVEQLRRVIHITQSPIGLNPRSNPGTYVGVFDEVRKLFAATDHAQSLGYGEGHFSFNTPGGRCEVCEGYGAKKVKLHFMADVWVRCKECEGRRFTPEILAVTYMEKNIADILEMDVETAYPFFQNSPQIERMLKTMLEVGLGYLKLGQNAMTLSGGEAQRVKLAKELSRRTTGSILYILDEPTTGLHLADTQRLLNILYRLVENGNTVMVIEHNLDVIKTADWIIDLGPEGGDAGGEIVAAGTPEYVTSIEVSHTGKYLRRVL